MHCTYVEHGLLVTSSDVQCCYCRLDRKKKTKEYKSLGYGNDEYATSSPR